MMKKNEILSDELTIMSFKESCAIYGGAITGWDYDLAEYLGMGVGYGAKKLWRLAKTISANLYTLSSNPKLLYQ
jgi:hypothetical protein